MSSQTACLLRTFENHWEENKEVVLLFCCLCYFFRPAKQRSARLNPIPEVKWSIFKLVPLIRIGISNTATPDATPSDGHWSNSTSQQLVRNAESQDPQSPLNLGIEPNNLKIPPNLQSSAKSLTVRVRFKERVIFPIFPTKLAGDRSGCVLWSSGPMLVPTIPHWLLWSNGIWSFRKVTHTLAGTWLYVTFSLQRLHLAIYTNCYFFPKKFVWFCSKHLLCTLIYLSMPSSTYPTFIDFLNSVSPRVVIQYWFSWTGLLWSILMIRVPEIHWWNNHSARWQF